MAGNGNKGDVIRVRVTVSDGVANSAPITSAPVTILNTAPAATVALNDHSPNTNATLTATTTASDVDPDTVTLTYVWRVDGVARKTTVSTGLSDTFDLSAVGNGNNGQTVTVTVTPTDGTQNGAPVCGLRDDRKHRAGRGLGRHQPELAAHERHPVGRRHLARRRR